MYSNNYNKQVNRLPIAPLLPKKHDNLNYNNVLHNLQDFMLTSKTLTKSLSNRLLIESRQTKQIKIKPEKSDIYIPTHIDTLFVCFYKIINKDTFENDNITFTIEKKIKIEYIEKLRNQKQLIKKYKFASISHIENQLVNEHKIDIFTFLTLCVIENINIIYIYKRTYFELLMNNEQNINNDVHIIHFLDKLSKYGYEGFSNDKVKHYRSELYKIDNINKPLKAISYYKIQELIDICNKLSIHTDADKKKTKKDLYELIIKTL